MASDYGKFRRIHGELLAALISGSGIHAESKVLEQGCGTGNYISALHFLIGCSAWGVDSSSDMLSQAESQTARVAWICAPAEKMRLSDVQFDFVYSVDAVHHFRDRPSVLSETERLLTAGGIVCIATDSEATIRNRKPLSVYWPETVELELARYPSIDVLEAELSNCGFVELRHQEVAAPSWLIDASAYRAKAFSCLRLLPEQTFERGLRHLEADLAKAPVRAISRYDLLWATKPLLTR